MAQTTWAHRATHPLVRRLIGTPVRPNHLTAVRLATGLAAAWCFARGAAGWAGSWFLVSAWLDRADGELARMSGQTSRLGHQLDFASDIAITGLAFLGIGLGLRGDPLVGPLAVGLGMVAAMAIVAIFLLAMRLEAFGTTAFGGRSGFDPDDALFLVAPIAWLGGLPWLLLGAAIGAPLILAGALWYWRCALHINAPGAVVADERD